MKKDNNQKSILFDSSISHIDTSSDNSNIVHKKSVTSVDNYSIELKLKFYSDEISKVNRQYQNLNEVFFNALMKDLETDHIHEEFNVLNEKEYFLSELYYFLHSKKNRNNLTL